MMKPTFLRVAIALFLTRCPEACCEDADGHFPTFEVTTEFVDEQNSARLIRQIQFKSDDELLYYIGHEREIGVPWRQDPFALFVRISAAGVEKYRPFNRSLRIQRSESSIKLPSPIGEDVFFIFSPAWPLASHSPPMLQSMPNGVVLDSQLFQGTYTATGRIHFMLGVKCVEMVDAAGLDTVWVMATDLSCVIRREWRYAKSKRLAGELQTRETQFLRDNTAIPSQVEMSVFLDADDQLSPDHRTTTSVKVLDLDLGEIWSGFCRERGIIEVASDGSFIQKSEGGSEMVASAAKILRMQYPYVGRPAMEEPHFLKRMLAFFFIGTGSGFLATKFLRRLRSIFGKGFRTPFCR